MAISSFTPSVILSAEMGETTGVNVIGFGCSITISPGETGAGRIVIVQPVGDEALRSIPLPVPVETEPPADGGVSDCIHSCSGEVSLG